MNDYRTADRAQLSEVPAGGNDFFSYFCLAALSICLGSTFYFQSFALQDMSAAVAGALRLIFCAAALVPAALIAGNGLPDTFSGWSWATFNGLIGFYLPFNLSIWAQQYIATSVAATIYSVIPLLVLALARLVLGVHISARKWFGLMLGTAGLVVLALPEGAGGGFLEGGLMAKAAMLLAALMLAIAGIAIRKMPATPPLAAMAAASLVAALLSLPVVIISLPGADISPMSFAAIVAAGVFSTAFGQTIRFYLVRRRGPVFIAPNAYLAAFVATVLGVVGLGEVITYTLVFGFCIILVGLIVAQDGTGKMAQI